MVEKKSIYSKSRRPALVALVAALVLLLVVSGTMAYIITRTDPVRNSFVSGLPPLGGLSIHKTVTHPFGTEYIVPDNPNTRFTFRVALGADHAGEIYSGHTADANGVIELTIKAGETAGLEDLPAGLQVKVSEAGGNNGFMVQPEQTVTILRDQIRYLTFNNPYAPDEAENDVTVHGEKQLVGRDWMEGDRFTFCLEQYKDGEWVSLAEKEISPEFDDEGVLVPESVCFDFDDAIRAVALDDAGSLSFRVREMEGSIGGILYDPAISLFDLLVTDADMDGALELSRITTTTENNTEISGHAVSVLFKNEYAPEGSAEIVLPIVKELDDKSGAGRDPSGFVFELYDEDGEKVAETGKTNAAGQTSVRLLFGAEDAGKTYFFVLKEQLGIEPGMEYDKGEYIIRVRVTDNLDGTISAVAEPVGEIGEGRNAGVPVAPHQSSRPGSQEPETEAATEPVTTEEPVRTEPPEDTEEPRQLTPPATEPEPDTTDAPGPTGESWWQGEDTQEDLSSRTSAGLPVGAHLMRYIRYLTKALTRNLDGAYLFTNVYRPKAADVKLTGVKRLSGRSLRDGEFSFALYLANENFEPVGNAVQTVQNDGDGDFVFAPLSFDRIGTFRFVAEELSGEEKGISYDPVRYQITVVVTDTGGELEAEVSCSSSYGEADGILFQNEYQPESVAVVIGGVKELEGKDLAAGMFAFELSALNGTERDALQTAQNGADGTFAFRELRFYETGEWHFCVRELPDAALPGVDYDNVEYEVRIRVTDNGQGNLVAKTDCALAGKYVEELRFHNVYSADYASVVVLAGKTVENGTLKGGDFSFLLCSADENFVEDGEVNLSAKNDANGTIEFGALTFTKPGTYRFIVMEDTAAKENGVTYDDTVYRVTVNVTDDGKGKLVAEKYIEKNGEAVDVIQFHNVFAKQSPPTPPKPVNPDTPHTGDDHDATVWYWIFGLSLTGLAAVGLVVLHDRRKKVKQNPEKED